ncbi:MAG TPA: ABC transporter permease [Defluviitaleaceae bacterium]|jgi:NitT/TauT family transport system permease protein|nr:ABC transporter permease [Candidatus Epulonipiscium sp.]HOQ17712.1 ABC transporter permease [Defluviitaleaceae bacterium]HPT75586.1 ABC transporter permease [Defluviitaleaceae bacterium]HQD50089.1 ABC transporter permease [Defluviitaleaceae bacterium]
MKVKAINYSKDHLKYLSAIKRREKIIKASQIFILVSFLLLWEMAANFGWIDAFIFSQPSKILKTLWEMALDGSIFLHTGISLFETVAGFLLSTLLGTSIAVLLWWNNFILRVTDPYLVILNSLPKTALAPILIVWMGNNMKSILFTAVLMSIVVTALTVLNGFQEVDQDKIKLIESFGGNKKDVLIKVMIPANVPTIINALKVNVGLSLVGVMVGEFLVAKAGLGYLIIYGSQIFKLDWVMLSIVVLAFLAALLYKMVLILERRFLKWRE